MRFVDEVKIKVRGGNGGDGCLSFRREKYIPRGGPDGGDGGRGGSVILRASKDVQTLIDFRYLDHYDAPNGEGGQGSQRNGKSGDDITLNVPLGTLVTSDDGLIQLDLTQDGQTAVVAEGGLGGLGNIHFKSSTNRTPRQTRPGEPGKERTLYLELQVLADIGLVGLPNVGKSSLLGALTSAHPKIGDYPFTTLAPILGSLEMGETRITIADIPGILERAHEGVGLGLQFLRHISRADVLLFVLAYDPSVGLESQLQILLAEIQAFDPTLLKRKRMVAINKADKLEDYDDERQRDLWNEEWIAFHNKYPESELISAKTGLGLNRLKDRFKVIF